MTDLRRFIEDNREFVHELLCRYLDAGRPFLLRSDLWDRFEDLVAERGRDDLRGSILTRAVAGVQEAALERPWVLLALRPTIGRWRYLRIHADELDYREIDVAEYLRFKERLVDGHDPGRPRTLEIDLGPFNREFPKLRESRSIGRGVEFLNRHLSSKLFQDLDVGDSRLLDFLRVHQVGGRQLMLNGAVETVSELRRAVGSALELLSEASSNAGWKSVGPDLRALGFEPGWGRTTTKMRSTFRLLLDILEAPDPRTFERFLSRIPMIFNVVILSPHGWFGQSNVLGRPDTGGQIVYILDQVRALETEMTRRIRDQGLDIEPRILVVTRLIPDNDGTTSDQREEPIAGTRHAKILRVPFRRDTGEVVPHWISRFKVWPYLERFAYDVETEILAELGTRPDLVIGNYSDGNIVASLLSSSLGITQCNIAHALEKTKYLMSDLYWKDNEEQHHFACQFTADLIAMNTADFIITSTYQEIAGREDGAGQYESYASFTLPGLYRVIDGIDLFDPKFNIVSPGADPKVFFPYGETDHRPTHRHDELTALLFPPAPDDRGRGFLERPGRPVVFTMARLDRIKNLTGLVEWYGRCDRLRGIADLLIVGSFTDPARSQDDEEKRLIETMHGLFDRHRLDGSARWVERQGPPDTGEIYRLVADRRGVFVQPALFEAFGLTVVEAMACGLPTFATCYGGPLEIIEHDVSGFHVDPNHGDRAADDIAGFLERCADDGGEWERISRGALARVKRRYTWKLYAERLMTLSRVYGFWRHVTDLERAETRRYLEMLYALQYRPLAAAADR